MTDLERLGLLRQAEDNLVIVRDSLNNKSGPCGCCGLTVYENKGHWCMTQSLVGAIGRIEKVREELLRMLEKKD